MNIRTKKLIEICQRWNRREFPAGNAMNQIWDLYKKENRKEWQKMHKKRREALKIQVGSRLKCEICGGLITTTCIQFGRSKYPNAPAGLASFCSQQCAKRGDNIARGAADGW